MPRVKVDYVVSVSSEDPENQANNLLAGEVSKKKWLCGKGEQSCSVVLQLTRAVTISAVHIGAHHTAFVEVLVGTSEKANEDYEVLVPRCVFCSPSESRRDEPVQRVRSFSGEQLAAASSRRWDRLRVLCSQPYNKHCQFGLSFIHIFEPEVSPDTPVEPKPVNPAITALSNKDKFLSLGSYSSDEDDFRPGELFAKHRQSMNETNDNNHASNTETQIRQATSQALRNISDADTTLKKTLIAKRKRQSCDPGESVSQSHDRSRDSLIYTADEDRPHSKIDRLITKHKEDKKKSDETQNIKKDKVETNKNSHRNRDDSFRRNKEKTRKNINQSASSSKTPQNRNNEDERRKRQRSADDNTKGGAGEAGGAMRGVVFALSGFVAPQRGHLRDGALALGAAYRPAWGPDCTHLVCAFANTPKLRLVADTAPHAHIVSGAWLAACAKQGRRLPEGPFALVPRAPTPPHPHPQEGDTDDEIEKVVRQQKKKLRRERSPPPSAATSPTNDASSGEATEPEGEASSGEEGEEAGRPPLADFLEGTTLTVAEDVREAGFSASLLRRYARAYGALVVGEGEADRSLGLGPRQLRPDWLWRCHRHQRLLPPDAEA